MSIFPAFLKRFLSVKQHEHTPAEILYHACLDHSRTPQFYADFEVSDSLDSRFDALCLSLACVMFRFSSVTGDAAAETKKLSQDIFDNFCADMDLSVREMGVGDLGVAKRVKKMSEAFIGRLDSYSTAFEQKDIQELSTALSRNLYRTDTLHPKSESLARAVLRLVDELSSQSDSNLCAGQIILSPLSET